jgi:glycosyltransferase involved in cell wall biosynthesis
MRIGIFPAIIGRKGGGVETYEASLVRGLVNLKDNSEFHLYCLGQSAVDAFALEDANVTYEILQPSARWLSIPFSLPRAISRSNVDIVHATFVPPFRCSVPLIVSVHDVCVHTHPNLYPLTIRMRLNYLLYKRLNKFEHIICPTQVSKQLVVEHFGVREDRVSIIPYAVEAEFRPASGDPLQGVLEKYKITQPYFLFAGNLRVGNKNLVRLLEAYALFRRECSREAKLVLTGRRSWQSKVLDATIDRLDLRSSIVETGWLPPEDVPALYSGARALLFPSLCEGFGLPALESMACGTPVITSNLSCLPEVTGNASLLVDPYSVAAIADGMACLFRDDRMHADLREKGLKWIQQFSWARTARETRAVYDRVLRG